MGRVIENQIFTPVPFLDDEELIARLRPNGWFERLKFGYLGPHEDLHQIIREDGRTLAQLRLSYEQIAVAIEQLFATDDEEINGDPIIRMQYVHSPVCPWGDFCAVSTLYETLKVTEIIVCHRRRCPKWAIDHLLKNQGTNINDYPRLVKKGWGMIFSDLHPHLIRAHHFFEGNQTPYRVDPQKVKVHLGIR